MSYVLEHEHESAISLLESHVIGSDLDDRVLLKIRELDSIECLLMNHSYASGDSIRQTELESQAALIELLDVQHLQDEVFLLLWVLGGN